MNNTVTVTGMAAKTKVSNNLLIAPWDDANAHKGNEEDKYVSSIEQVVKGILEPVSTVDGINFYYTATNNVVADGDAKTDAYIKYGTEAALTGEDATKYNDAFSKNYDITKTGAADIITGETGAKAYIDYTFFLKATNTDSAVAEVALTKCNLLYDAAAIASGKAFRVAVYAQESAKETGTTGDGTLVTILTLDGAENFTDNKAVASTSALGDVTYNDAATIDDTLASGATKYYKVVVRLWLEGEDNTCNNDTYAILNGEYSLNLEFKIGTLANIVAVANIGSSLS